MNPAYFDRVRAVLAARVLAIAEPEQTESTPPGSPISATNNPPAKVKTAALRPFVELPRLKVSQRSYGLLLVL